MSECKVIPFRPRSRDNSAKTKTPDEELAERVERIQNTIQRINVLTEQLRKVDNQ